MFPLYDENPTRITPYFTYGLIGMNVVVFLHEVSLSNTQLEQFFQLYAVVPEQLTTNWSGEWTTLFTSQFLHGGWWHLISNMIYLWVFGNNIEDRLGHLKYLFFYLTCGALAALCQWFIGINSIIPSLGASGAISGVLGAYLIWFPSARITTLIFLGFFITTINVPALVIIGIFFIQNLISGFASLQTAANMSVETGGVAYWAHLGGFIVGMIFAFWHRE
ncbi:rhomboid family intramembrane serine protease [Dolichospermum circinale]|uniref:rhomboid family intramembrane serine protease n=1 Tax=Dolichospermum circinale TaxID=109265 RepID=UPI0003FF8BA4|nr:rhomboid family intramembrane serine protease [Dolichospermum circinale]MDB9482875.1 rhomboid family intramembrane serine protease [Dolichospermum circinale CS-537/05]MDB9453009.1 rhomboid family intramembrane serine protease [Dolichospermum circinale CS-541/06]MDB9463933.1 rhomboid family intramembrane serine protease [Dolichospermum circinale CS-541/04]MDB9473438.1 rhomboid family intramembrane serine protease [Dolichospermum circinale CS-537/11]MDB9478081.1 rhomboid family intramembrane 